MPIADARRVVAEGRFGIEEERLQRRVNEVRGKGARVVALLSHNGMDVDLKLAARVTGIDVILGGHTHDGVPVPIVVANASGKTLVTNAGSNGKFLAVLDLAVKDGRISDYRYRLLPVFAELLRPDAAMARLIEAQRSPYAGKLSERLALTEALLYRRGNFNGSFDQLILDALMEAKGAPIAFSPGFRWGATLLPGEPGAQRGARIGDMRIGERPIEPGKTYKVASWASVAEGARDEGEPAWDLLARYLREKKIVRPSKLKLPRLIGVKGNRGLA